MAHVLATALGRLAAKRELVCKIALPARLPRAFLHEVAAAARGPGSVAYVVTRQPGPGEISPGEAIRYRSPSDPGIRSVLLVSSVGDLGDLKSLETNTDLLSGGLPGGLRDGEQAHLDVEAIASEVTAALQGEGAGIANAKAFAASLQAAMEFLGQAYQEAGNAGLDWIEAFWSHLDMTVVALPAAIAAAEEAGLAFPERAVFTAAGLPLPSTSTGFGIAGTPKAYTDIVLGKWGDRASAASTVADIAFGTAAGTHALQGLDWQDYPLSIGMFPHPILALTQHGRGHAGPPAAGWTNAWLATSEDEFFRARATGTATVSFECETAGGGWEPVAPAGPLVGTWLLPVPANKVVDGAVHVARLRALVNGTVPVGAVVPAIVNATLSPKTAFSVSVESVAARPDGLLEVIVCLSKKASGTVKWPEQPVTLSLKGQGIAAARFFSDGIVSKFLVPNPARASCFVLEGGAPGKKPKPYFHSQLALSVDDAAQSLVVAAGDDIPEISLPASARTLSLACLNLEGEAEWEGGTPLTRRPGHDASGGLHLFAIQGIPEDGVLDLGGFQVRVSQAEHATGQLSPIHAAFAGEQVRAPTNDELSVLAADPRWVLEEWLAQECIEKAPGEGFRSSLGRCVLAIGKNRGSGKLSWNSDIKLHSDITTRVAANTTGDALPGEAVDAFWAAFSGLGLPQCVASFPHGCLPGLLDLSAVPGDAVAAYLGAYSKLLEVAAKTRGQREGAWPAFPFSATLFDTARGRHEGVLLSPLHPIRFAWVWSVQQAAAGIIADPEFGHASTSFMRFVDGECFPMAAPGLEAIHQYLLPSSLSPGPREYFAGWSLLASPTLDERLQREGLDILARCLALGSPSGLSSGGVAASIKDYLRNFPLTPQLRVKVAGQPGHERFAATDQAVIDASSRVMSQLDISLPGGVRVFDSPNRGGRPPTPDYALARIESGHLNAGLPPPAPSIEWVVTDRQGQVDLLLLESSPVTLDLVGLEAGKGPGTTGPSLPLARFRAWPEGPTPDPSHSTTWLPLSESAYGGLPGFREALEAFERLALDGPSRLACQLDLGENLGIGHAMWAVTGNRNLNPAALSARLEQDTSDHAMWEWRPAFLGRDRRTRESSELSTSHPYTVLARPGQGLGQKLQDLFSSNGVPSPGDRARDVIRDLGARGVGLSSLLSMGHTQAMGAVGFYLAFKALEDWERGAPAGTVRCIVPVDACFPFIDAMAAGRSELESNKRADLLLLEARMVAGRSPELVLHPVEIKARSMQGGVFPSRDSNDITGALGQLEATRKVIDRFAERWAEAGGRQPLVNAAFAALLEACLALKPASLGKDTSLEIALVEAVALGRAIVQSSHGTLLWFQSGGHARNGAPFESRMGEATVPGQFLSSLAAATPSADRVSPVACEVTQTVMTSWPPQGTGGAAGPDGPSPAPPSIPPPAGPTGNVAPGSAPATLGDGASPAQDGMQSHPEGSGRPGETHGAAPGPEGGQGDGEEAAQPSEPLRGTASGTSHGISVLVGTTDGSTPVTYNPSDTRLNQLNVGVVGDLGTGKTQFLQSFVYQLVSSAPSNRGVSPKAFIFDYKDDYSGDRFKDAIGAKVLDPTATLPINFFQLDEGALQSEQIRRAIFFSSTLDTIARIGQVQKNMLMNAVLDAYKSCAPGYSPMLGDVLDTYKAKVNGKPDTVISILEKLVLFQVFETDPSKVISFREFFDRSIVLKLTTLAAAGQELAEVVVSIFLDHLYFDYMKRVEKPGFEVGDDDITRRVVDTVILIDEAHHAMSQGYDVLMKLMLEGREFGLGVILSSQYLSHFQQGKTDWAEPLSTWVVHKIRGVKGRDFDKIGFAGDTSAMAANVSQLQTHWAYYRCDNDHPGGLLMRGQPFFSLES